MYFHKVKSCPIESPKYVLCVMIQSVIYEITSALPAQIHCVSQPSDLLQITQGGWITPWFQQHARPQEVVSHTPTISGTIVLLILLPRCLLSLVFPPLPPPTEMMTMTLHPQNCSDTTSPPLRRYCDHQLFLQSIETCLPVTVPSFQGGKRTSK